MYPAKFDYHRAASVEEALELLAANEDAKLLAGGHSLLPMMKMRLAQPATLIDIGRVEGLRGIRRDGETVRVGALSRHAEIAASEELAASCPLLAEAAAAIGDLQVRNRGTIGGNIAHADPASDLPAVLRVLAATIHVVAASGPRAIPAADFFVDLLTTDLGEHELITEIEIPVATAGTGSAYLKFEHPASGYAVVGAAATLTLDGGRCTAAGLAFNGLAASPYVADVAGLVGGGADDAAIAAAVDPAIVVEDPLGDVFASGEYRVHLAKVYGRRALRAARDRAS